MTIIAVKCDKTSLKKFEQAGFKYYELYIKADDSLDEVVYSKLKPVSVHVPSYVIVDGKLIRMNLSDPGLIGDKSEQRLRQTIEYAKKLNCSKVVVHTDSSGREDACEIAAKRLEKANDPDVLICIENLPQWKNLPPSLTNDADAILKLKNKAKIPLGVVLDIAHIYLTAAHENKDPEKLIQDFFEKIKPDIIHVCGSDPANYTPSKVSTLIGEHFPVAFEGILEGKHAKDKTNHKLWTSLLQDKETPIVLEIDERPDYDRMKELVKGKEFIESLLK